MNRTTIYTMTAPKWVDFTQSINGQIVGTIGVSVTGLDHGKQALIEGRALALKNVVTSGEGKPRYKYSICTSMDFPEDSFKDASKPFSLRHVKEVKVAKASGTEFSVDAEVAKITEALKPLNKFLEVVPTSNKRQHIEEWQKALDEILEEVNQKAKKLGCFEIIKEKDLSEVELRRLGANADSKSLWQRLSDQGYKFIIPAMLVAGWSVISSMLMADIGFKMAIVSCYKGEDIFSGVNLKNLFNSKNQTIEFSLQTILTHLLNDEGLSVESRDSYISQYLKAAEQRPDLLNAETLCNDLFDNYTTRDLESVLFFSMVLVTMWYLWNLCKTCCKR